MSTGLIIILIVGGLLAGGVIGLFLTKKVLSDRMLAKSKQILVDAEAKAESQKPIPDKPKRGRPRKNKLVVKDL